jgi:hypothetical protein
LHFRLSLAHENAAIAKSGEIAIFSRMERIAGPVRITGKWLLPGISMLDPVEDDLRRKALVAMQLEVLPRVPPLRTWGGSGSGELCPVCGDFIEPADKELELEFATAHDGSAVREFHLHLPCFAAWDIARQSAADEE